MELYAGIDVGGTNVKMGIIDLSGNIYAKTSIKIKNPKDSDEVIEDIAKSLSELTKDANGEAISVGIGIPGLIDADSGVVVRSGNLDWTNVHFSEKFEKCVGIKPKIDNDANVAALGEARFGVGNKFKNLVMLTLGTGVGSGIILDGKIYSGKRSAGAEIGHMIINVGGRQCTCGNRGCFEAYASATALKQQTKDAMLADKNSKMWEIGSIDEVGGRTAFNYSEIDATAKSVVDGYIEGLSVGIVNVANIFRPDAIILGGGVSNEGDRLLKPLKQKLDTMIFAGNLGPKVELLLAKLRNDAGFMGAAALNMPI